MTFHKCKLLLEGGFLSGLKMGRSSHSQTSKLAFLVDFSVVLQLKNTILGLIGTQEMRIFSFKKWVWPVLMQMKMKSTLEVLLGEFRKNNTIDRL